MDFIDNFDTNKNNNQNSSVATKENNLIEKANSLKSKTLNMNSKKNEINYNPFRLQNINSTFMVPNCFLEKNQNVFIKKKTNKKVKFVDEVYNKNLVEEILIKSFKGYNMKNNFSTNKETTSSCSVFKNTACCIII